MVTCVRLVNQGHLKKWALRILIREIRYTPSSTPVLSNLKPLLSTLLHVVCEAGTGSLVPYLVAVSSGTLAERSSHLWLLP